MKLKAFEAHWICGHFTPKNLIIGSVVEKLSPKNRGVGVKLSDTVYYGPKSYCMYTKLFIKCFRHVRSIIELAAQQF